MIIANEQLLDIDDVLKRYRRKAENSLSTQSNTVKKNCYVLWNKKK
jgi:hypothetical protein